VTSIGTTLKEARTKKEISLEDVHAKLKIHPRVLQLLEEEKFDKLPSPLFAKSFLRSYAQFLEVNADEIIDNYEKEKKLPEPEQKMYIKPVDMSGARKIPASWWTAGIIAALIVGAAMFAPTKQLSSWASKLKMPAVKFQKKAVAPKEKKASSPKAEEAQAPAVESTDTWLSSVKLGNFPKLNKKQPLDLQIKALDAVWVHITSDGKVLYQGVLKKGGGDAWQAKNAIEIWTGNASNMSLTLNKAALGSPGKGVVKKMIISHEGIRIASAGE